MNNQAQVDAKDEVKVEDAVAESRVVYKLRDITQGMVHAWESVFPKSYKNVQVSLPVFTYFFTTPEPWV